MLALVMIAYRERSLYTVSGKPDGVTEEMDD